MPLREIGRGRTARSKRRRAPSRSPPRRPPRCRAVQRLREVRIELERVREGDLRALRIRRLEVGVAAAELLGGAWVDGGAAGAGGEGDGDGGGGVTGGGLRACARFLLRACRMRSPPRRGGAAVLRGRRGAHRPRRGLLRRGYLAGVAGAASGARSVRSGAPSRSVSTSICTSRPFACRSPRPGAHRRRCRAPCARARPLLEHAPGRPRTPTRCTISFRTSAPPSNTRTTSGAPSRSRSYASLETEPSAARPPGVSLPSPS